MHDRGVRDSLIAECDALAGAADGADRCSFDAALQRAHRYAAAAGPGDSAAAMRILGRHLDRFDPCRASWVAVLAADLTRRGADPAPVLPAALACLKTTAEAAVYFAGAWRDACDGPLPGPADASCGRVRRLVEPVLGDATTVVIEGWSCLPRWTAATRAMLAASTAARCLGIDIHHLVRAVTAVAEHYPPMDRVRALLVPPAAVRT